ncbi:MAG: hypothetical protein R3F61_26775 [Myxococcota bacterium]
MLAALIAVAWAEPTCQSLESERFRSLLVDAQSELDRGDLAAVKTVLSEISRDLPCLKQAPPPRLWAELMAVQAVASFADGGDWQSPLAAALRIRPSIDRGVGRSHPIYSWEPEPEPEWLPYEGEATLYVDGRQVDRRPPADGWYLVQKTDGDYWESYWQRDTPVSTSWIDAPVDRPEEVFWQVSVGLQGGLAHIVQEVEAVGPSGVLWRPYDSRFYSIGSPYRAPEYTRPGWGMIFKGRATYRHLGVSLGGSVVWNLAPGLKDGRITAIYDTRHASIGAGVSINDIFLLTKEIDAGKRAETGPIALSESHLERFYHLEGAVRSTGSVQGELTVLAGFHSLHTYNGLMDFTITFDEIEILGARPQIGGQAGLSMGRFVWTDGDDRQDLRLTSTGLRATTHLTLLLGRKRR